MTKKELTTIHGSFIVLVADATVTVTASVQFGLFWRFWFVCFFQTK